MQSILTTTSSFGKSAPYLIDKIQKLGLKLIMNPYQRKVTEEELIVLLKRYKPLGLLAGIEPISESVLIEAKDFLRVISRMGVGWDNVDRATAKNLGILVYRTEGVLNQAVAELTLGLILSALRKIVSHDAQIRKGLWQKQMGALLKGKIVGIIGFGAIGQRVGELVRAFGAEVLYYDIASYDFSWAVPSSLDKLLEKSDILTLHVSGREQILGIKELNRLQKPEVILVNTARGGLINEAALYKTLESGKVAFACLDVFEDEPYSGNLINLDNVIVTPHIGSYAYETRIKMEKLAVDNLINGLLKYGINFK